MDIKKRLNFMKWALLAMTLSVMGQTFAIDEAKEANKEPAEATATATATAEPAAVEKKDHHRANKKAKRHPHTLRQLFQHKTKDEVIEYCTKELAHIKTKEAAMAENPLADSKKTHKKNEWDHSIALATFHLDWIVNHKDVLSDKEVGFIGRQCLAAIKKAYFLSGDKKHQFSS